LAATLDICGVARGLKKRAWSPPNAATNGVIGGVLAGYNWQAGPWVFGLEATSAGLMRTVRERPFSSFSRIRTT
jgi:hypothetical protein